MVSDPEEKRKEEQIEKALRRFGYPAWSVRKVKEDFKEKGQIPTIRRIKNAGGVPTKDVYACFPEGPAKKSAMISGLGKPQGCV